jgi:hypothetical protein
MKTFHLARSTRFAIGAATLFASLSLVIAGAVPALARSTDVPYAPPAGLAVDVALITELNSGTCTVGDRFEFETTKDVTLGTIVVPKGTHGHGRVASVSHADAQHDGTIAIQVDTIDMPDGTVVWVDMDPRAHLGGRLADKHTRIKVLAVATTYSGEMVLPPGTSFDVLTIAPRKHPAALAAQI